MVIENLTGRNVFSALGGVAEITRVRDGRLRCQASFSHPILTGNFGASTAALLGALWLAVPARRVLYTVGLLSAAAIVVLSASSGPVLALAAGILGWVLFPMRANFAPLRIGALVMVVVLHFVREQPVWQLIARVSSITGGTGYHRFLLIDRAISHFDEWWLLGATTAHWQMAQPKDITNQYILEGIRGGFAALLAFIVVLVVGFRSCGQSMRVVAKSGTLGRRDARRVYLLAYGLGVMLFAHSVAFIGVSYFGQMTSIFYLHLAMISSVASSLERTHGSEARARLERQGPLAFSALKERRGRCFP